MYGLNVSPMIVMFQIEQKVNRLIQMNNNDPELEHRSLDNGDHVS